MASRGHGRAWARSTLRHGGDDRPGSPPRMTRSPAGNALRITPLGARLRPVSLRRSVAYLTRSIPTRRALAGAIEPPLTLWSSRCSVPATGATRRM